MCQSSPQSIRPQGFGAQTLALLASLALAATAAAAGGWLTETSRATWYAALDRPNWAPPDAVFGPVWTLLYALMAIAAWLVWRAPPSSDTRRALALYSAQLALNLLWSALFFGLRRPAWALVEIFALWSAIAMTTIAFWRVRRLAGALLLPYLAWVSFAVALNAAFWWLNR
jgi:tryptophan-rich sensory protein